MAAPEVGTVAAATWDSYKGMSSDNIKGLALGLSSSFFIGASFIVKKKGLSKAGASGVRAGEQSCTPFVDMYLAHSDFSSESVEIKK